MGLGEIKKKLKSLSLYLDESGLELAWSDPFVRKFLSQESFKVLAVGAFKRIFVSHKYPGYVLKISRVKGDWGESRDFEHRSIHSKRFISKKYLRLSFRNVYFQIQRKAIIFGEDEQIDEKLKKFLRKYKRRNYCWDSQIINLGYYEGKVVLIDS